MTGGVEAALTTKEDLRGEAMALEGAGWRGLPPSNNCLAPSMEELLEATERRARATAMESDQWKNGSVGDGMNITKDGNGRNMKGITRGGDEEI